MDENEMNMKFDSLMEEMGFNEKNYPLGNQTFEKIITDGKYYVDKCVTSVSGIEPDEGCYAAIPSEASMKRTLVAHARETILLVDHTKFNRKAFCLAFDLSRVSTIVTDSQTPKDEVERLRSKGISVHVV